MSGLSIFGQRPIESAWRSAGDVARDAIAEMDVMHEYPDAVGLHTSIPALTEAIKRVLSPGRLIVLVGQSGGMKSATGTQWAVEFASQVPTFLMTLEDDPRDAVKRQLAQLSRESVGAIRDGFPKVDVPSSVYDAAGALEGLQLDYNHELGEPTVEEIAIIMMAWRKKHADAPHAVVIIDQLSHIRESDPDGPFWRTYPNYPKPPWSGSLETKVLEWQTSMLRQMAVKHRMTVVLMHQLNDNVDESSGKPTLKSIRSSRGIAHKADLVLVPWVPARVPNPFAGPGDAKTLENTERKGHLISLKTRVTAPFEIPVQFLGAQQRFIADGDVPNEKWAPVAAPSVRQLEGARKLLALQESFAAAALARCQPPVADEKQDPAVTAADSVSLPAAIETTVVEDHDDDLWFPGDDDRQIPNEDSRIPKEAR